MRSNAFHAGVRAGADKSVSPASSVQGAGTAGQRKLNDAILFSGGKESPFPAGRAEQGQHRRLYAVGKMHGTGIPGDENARAGKQGDELAEAGLIDEIE